MTPPLGNSSRFSGSAFRANRFGSRSIRTTTIIRWALSMRWSTLALRS